MASATKPEEHIENFGPGLLRGGLSAMVITSGRRRNHFSNNSLKQQPPPPRLPRLPYLYFSHCQLAAALTARRSVGA
jgi:hypothetical protein